MTHTLNPKSDIPKDVSTLLVNQADQPADLDRLKAQIAAGASTLAELLSGQPGVVTLGDTHNLGSAHDLTHVNPPSNVGDPADVTFFTPDGTPVTHVREVMFSNTDVSFATTDGTLSIETGNMEISHETTLILGGSDPVVVSRKGNHFRLSECTAT